MVLLSKISEDAIVDNLKKRYMDDYIFVSFLKRSDNLPLCVYAMCNIARHVHVASHPLLFVTKNHNNINRLNSILTK